jgi:hypothetical protein
MTRRNIYRESIGNPFLEKLTKLSRNVCRLGEVSFSIDFGDGCMRVAKCDLHGFQAKSLPDFRRESVPQLVRAPAVNFRL